MEEYRTNVEYCFICGRDLGPQLEWMKMQTERGPICYVCFNGVTNSPAATPIETEPRS